MRSAAIPSGAASVHPAGAPFAVGFAAVMHHFFLAASAAAHSILTIGMISHLCSSPFLWTDRFLSYANYLATLAYYYFWHMSITICEKIAAGMQKRRENTVPRPLVCFGYRPLDSRSLSRSYLDLVAIPPRICRSLLFFSSTCFTCWYSCGLMAFKRSETSLCFVVMN